MAGIFDDEKYKVASDKAIAFIKRQLNVNNYSLFPRLDEDYYDGYTGRIIAHVDMPEDARVNYPNYIYCDSFYDEKYIGVCSGKHQNTLPATKNLGVEITTHTDQKYVSCVCPLHNNGTWKSETYYRETDFYGVGELVTKSITYWYRQDKVINEGGSNGIKDFSLKYYKWLDDEGAEVDVDNLPESVTEQLAPVPIDPITGEPQRESFLYAKTYTLRPFLLDDTIIDDALPRYADYDTSLYVFADVEYLTETQSIIFDGAVGSSDLPSNPPILAVEPEPFIRDAIVQPYDTKGKLIITWITNFTDACVLHCDGTSQTVRGTKVAKGYYTYHSVIDASLNTSHTYTIEGKGKSITKSFDYVDNNRYLLAGDPQIIAEDSAEKWYKTQNILSPLPTLIIGMGDQVDAITDSIMRTEQYHMFTEKHSVPIATVRGNHDRNEHFLGHYGFPSNAEGASFYFKHNNVLFIAIDTNIIDCEAHRSFIQKALNSNSYRWAILLTHHSLYSTSQAAKTTHVKALREGLTDFIVNQTDICMVIAGHEHFLCRTNYPGKLFFTVPTCTGSKFQAADYPEAPWNEVTDDSKVPMYTVMDVSNDSIRLTTYDIDGNLKDSCVVS